MSMTLIVPPDVKAWVADVFRSCNERVSARISKMPTVQEASLDMTFIEHLAEFATPIKFDSEWIVRIDTHFLGGERHFMDRWEIADIGVLVIFRRGGKMVKSKIALLQSKRLYPVGQALNEETQLDYGLGFSRLVPPDEPFANLTTPRNYVFSGASKYKALLIGDEQYRAIRDYEQRYKVPIYYQFYNPWQIPSSSVIPVTTFVRLEGECEVGCRIIPAQVLFSILSELSAGSSPSYNNLKSRLPDTFTYGGSEAGWRLEHFISALLIECKEGYVAVDRNDEALFRVLSLRAAPISAAIAITFDAPQ